MTTAIHNNELITSLPAGGGDTTLSGSMAPGATGTKGFTYDIFN